jgi:hypothetical protein
MRLFFGRVKLRIWLAWCALCGRETAVYLSILRGRPVVLHATIHGTLEAGDNAIVRGCTVKRDDGKGDGFRVGANSVVIGCVAAGWSGYGYNTSGHASATMVDSPAAPSVFEGGN